MNLQGVCLNCSIMNGAPTIQAIHIFTKFRMLSKQNRILYTRGLQINTITLGFYIYTDPALINLPHLYRSCHPLFPGIFLAISYKHMALVQAETNTCRYIRPIL